METEISTPEEMIRLGAQSARKAFSGSVFGLVGNMGAGKTHWTKGFLQTIQPETMVTSPTFNLINEYRDGDTPVYHFDFYRMDTPGELIALGWDEYLEEAAIIICEWADRFPSLMPEKTTWLEFTCRDDGSRLVKETEKPPAMLAPNK